MWMLRSVQHDKADRVIPSASEESIVDASLRCAAFSMTRQGQNKRASATLALTFYIPNAQLFDQHHLLCLYKPTRLQAIKIHATGKPVSIPYILVIPRRLSLADQCGDLLAQDIIDL